MSAWLRVSCIVALLAGVWLAYFQSHAVAAWFHVEQGWAPYVIAGLILLLGLSGACFLHAHNLRGNR